MQYTSCLSEHWITKITPETLQCKSFISGSLCWKLCILFLSYCSHLNCVLVPQAIHFKTMKDISNTCCFLYCNILDHLYNFPKSIPLYRKHFLMFLPVCTSGPRSSESSKYWLSLSISLEYIPSHAVDPISTISPLARWSSSIRNWFSS